ncbi:MAG: response regulator [Pseudomonadota bacterium]
MSETEQKAYSAENQEAIREVPQVILLVEDSAIIAMDTTDILEEAGCALVLTAPDVETALSHLETESEITAGVLDVNLGATTSLRVAEALVERDIPFLLTTGYDDDPVESGYPAATVLMKPFGTQDLVDAVSSLALSDKRGGV